MHFNYLKWGLGLGLAGLGSLSGCASRSSVFTLQSEQKLSVYQDSEQELSVEAGQTTSLDSRKTTFIEAPGYVGLVVLPNEGFSGILKVRLKAIADFGAEVIQKKADGILNDLAPRFSDIQALLSKHRFEKALLQTEELERSYPKVASVRLLKSTCLHLLGRKDQAVAVVESVVQEFPENAVGKEFLATLQGKTPRVTHD